MKFEAKVTLLVAALFLFASWHNYMSVLYAVDHSINNMARVLL